MVGLDVGVDDDGDDVGKFDGFEVLGLLVGIGVGVNVGLYEGVFVGRMVDGKDGLIVGFCEVTTNAA